MGQHSTPSSDSLRSVPVWGSRVTGLVWFHSAGSVGKTVPCLIAAAILLNVFGGFVLNPVISPSSRGLRNSKH